MMMRADSGITDGGFSFASDDFDENVQDERLDESTDIKSTTTPSSDLITAHVVSQSNSDGKPTNESSNTRLSLAELRLKVKRNSEQSAARRSSHVSRRSSQSSRRSSNYSRRRSSVRSTRKSIVHAKEKKRELSYDEWVASFMTPQNRSSLTSIGSNSVSDVTSGNGTLRRKTKLTSTPTTTKKKCTYVSLHSGDAFVEKMHEIFFTKIRRGDGGDTFGEDELREVIRSALNLEMSGQRFSGSKKSQRRRATVIARMVFERSDYDCSNSVDFPEFLEFVVTLISAIFISQLTEQQQMSQDGDNTADECLNAASFRQMLRAVFGSDVLLKAHERKYQGKARRKIVDYKVQHLLALAEGIEDSDSLSWNQCFDLVLSMGSNLSMELFKCLEKESVTHVVWKDAQRRAHSSVERINAQCKKMGLG